MKVGLVCPYDIIRGGGVQECAIAMQYELSARGHSVIIISPKPINSKVPAKKQKYNIFVGSAAKIKSPFHTSVEVSASYSNEAIDKILNKEKFDILHFHEPWVPVLSRQLLARSKSINVATFHAKLPESTVAKTIERVITPYTKSILKHLDSLTAVSESAAEYVSSLTDQPINIIPNGINLAKYKDVAKNVSTTKPNILYIGRLEKRKGVKYLLKAYAQIVSQHPEVQLIVVGDGPERAKLETLAINLNLDNIKFLGFVSEKKKIKLLSEATIFTSPAVFGESFGIVLLEAMATGTVIVAGNNPGYAGVLKGRGALSLVNPKDTEQYAGKLAVMLDDKQLRKLWLSWAKKYIVNFDYKLVVDQYEQLYTSLNSKLAVESTPNRRQISK